METKNECLSKELCSLENALSNGYSIKARCKAALREVTIHPRLHEHKPPFVTATSSKSLEEALLRAAENYKRWRLGQKQIDYAKDDATPETDQKTERSLVILDMILFDGAIMELTKTKNGVKCKISGITIGKFTATRAGLGSTIFESIKKTLQKPMQLT